MKNFDLLTVFDTKHKREILFSFKEFKNAFLDGIADEYICNKDDYDEYLNNVLEDEEEKKEYIAYWKEPGRQVLDGKDYIKAIVEYDTWTSPRGVEPVTRFISVTGLE